LLVLVGGLIAAPVFQAARSNASRSAGTRVPVLLQAGVGIVIGLPLALWLPTRTRETPGSPANLVTVLVLWIIGGGFALLSTAMLLGAVVASPAAE
jgi:hypothetical protein